MEKEGMELDLGVIVKGFIIDEILKVFKENKVIIFIIDLGGNIYV